MFEIGNRIIYGTNGVCVVKEIRNSPFDPADPRQFYVLAPVYDTANLTIYTPVENDRVVMRCMMTPEEAVRLLELAPGIDMVRVEIEKKRRDIYRTIVQSADPVSYLSLIKTVAYRRAEFRKTRRRLPDLDNDFEHTARNALYGELAQVLGREREEIHEIIEKLTEPAAGTAGGKAPKEVTA